MITFHQYRSHPKLPQKDGVNHAHEEISEILLSEQMNGLEVKIHDFERLIKDEKYAINSLSHCKCVISNVGPHAHYYFYIREKYNLQYKIIRDVRTALWSSYLLQEHLIQPLLRPDDILIVATEFTHGLYKKIFPHIQESTVIKCYPLTRCFPKKIIKQNTMLEFSQVIKVGYLGRICRDKGFNELLEAVIQLNKKKDNKRKYQLLACGTIAEEEFSQKEVLKRLKESDVDTSCYHYLKPVPRTKIWDILKKFDLLVFPSVSNLETLGRVLLEASYCNLPILASKHAAGTELLNDPNWLLDVHYYTDKIYTSHFNSQIGKISAEHIAEKIYSHNGKLSACWKSYESHAKKLIHAAKTKKIDSDKLNLTTSQKRFINHLSINSPNQLCKNYALKQIQEMSNYFELMNDHNKSPQNINKLRSILKHSKHKKKTEHYLAKRYPHFDFTDVGGIDIEICNLFGFEVFFSIADINST